MRTTIRLFLLIEGVGFLAAGLVHRGMFITGYAHQQASIAETSIAVVLLIGLGLTWIWPGQTRLIGLVAQSFALLGTLVGVFTIAIGVGPRTAPDLAYHITILAVLALGLVVTARAPTETPQHAGGGVS
ncbi:MAG TPA: hypothetical protein VH349_07515 [Ktedonobacterales bacterium]|jgi:hypothetical protein